MCKRQTGKTALVLLASGYGQRFGANKLLADFSGQPLIAYTLRAAAASGADRVLVVTRYEEVSALVRAHYPDMRLVWNPHPERGISESIRIGLAALKEENAHYVGCAFLVCDQPFLTGESVRKLLASFWENPEHIHVCAAGERTGNPVLFPARFFPELTALSGDAGGRQILKKYPSAIKRVAIPEKEMYDIDNKVAMQLAQAGLRM